MKKLFTILAFLFIAFSLNAQDKIITTYGHAGVSNTQSTAAATAKVAAYSYSYMLNIPSAYVYTYQVHLDQASALDNTATVILRGSLDNVNYLALDTITWAGTTADTTITHAITSSPLSYKYLRLTITPTDSVWVKSIWLNVLPLN